MPKAPPLWRILWRNRRDRTIYRFSGGEVVFYRLKIRSKTANIAEVNGEKCEGVVNTLRVDVGCV